MKSVEVYTRDTKTDALIKPCQQVVPLIRPKLCSSSMEMWSTHPYNLRFKWKTRISTHGVVTSLDESTHSGARVKLSICSAATKCFFFFRTRSGRCSDSSTIWQRSLRVCSFRERSQVNSSGMLLFAYVCTTRTLEQVINIL